MATGFVILLALLATATARPEPQYIFSAPYYGTALSAALTAPVVPLTPVVPAPAIPVGAYSSVSSYAYGYQSTFPAATNPSANLFSAYTSLPLTYAPSAYYDYLGR